MKLYSDYPARRTRQIATDVAAIVALAASVWLGTTIFDLVIDLRSFGVDMEEAGSGFRSTMSDVSDTLEDVPLIGEGVTVPLNGASEAGASLESAGQAQQVAVERLALGLGIGIAAIPIAFLIVLWLIPRLRFARAAGTAKAIASSPESVDVLALRALTTQSIQSISKVHPDAAAAWRAGDTEVIRALASLELKATGVRLRSPS
jgi:hypothetical protein